MIELPVTFEVKGKQIVGMMHLPNRKNAPAIVMCHGWAAGKIGNTEFLFVKAARFFCKKGFAVLRFDHSGVADSEGDFNDYTTDQSLIDMRHALSFIEKFDVIDKSKIALVGHSMGGMNSIITAVKDKRVKCVVSWAGVANIEGMYPFWERNEIMKKGYIWSCGFKVTKKDLKEDLKWDTSKFVGKVKVPVMIVNGDNDENVRSSQADLLYKNANQPKKLLIIKGANHQFSEEKHQKILFENTVSWLKRWLK